MSKVKNFFKKRKAAILQLLGSLGMLMIAAVIGIIAGLYKTNNIDKYINEAVEYFDESNWSALYQYAEAIDNDFINEYFFEQMAENVYGSIKEGEASVGEIKKDGDKAYAVVTYKTEAGEASEVKLYFDQKDEKNYLFFNKWKLNIENDIIWESSITAPAGFEVYLDGVQLTSDNAVIERDEAAGIDVYTVPRLFKGEHTIYLQKDGIEVVEADVTWNEDKSSYESDIAKLQLGQAQTDSIEQAGKDIVKGMYAAIFSESGITDVSQYFKQDEATLAMLTAIYDNMLAAINPEDGSTLNSIDITGFTTDKFDYIYPDKVDLTMTFQCEFAARGKRSDKGGVRERYEGTTSSQIVMHFVKNGEDWICENLDMTCIDYSKQEEATE